MAETAVAPAPPVAATPAPVAPVAVPKAPEAPTINEARPVTPPKPSKTGKVEPKDVKASPEPPKAVTPPKQDPPAPFKKYTFDANGKKVEKVYNTEEDVRLALQKSLGIEEKMSEHTQKVKAAEELVSILQSTDPNAWKKFIKQCQANGIDAKKFATEILYDDIEWNKLTPEQQELRKFKEKEAEQLEAEELKKQEALKVQEAEAEQLKERKAQEWAKQFEAKCVEVLKSKQLPNTKLSISLVAHYMEAGLKQKQEYTLEQIIPYVQRDLKSLQKQTYDSLDGQALLDWLGPEIVEKITKAKVAKHNKGGKVFPDKEPEKVVLPPKEKTKTIKQRLRENDFDQQEEDFR
jgi:hypothetical protein